MKSYYVYIITNNKNTVLYTGVTNNLFRRIGEHKNKLFKGFASKYNCNKLVWYEETNVIHSAIETEKKIKAGSRQKKVDLISGMNPGWIDLSKDWEME